MRALFPIALALSTALAAACTSTVAPGAAGGGATSTGSAGGAGGHAATSAGGAAGATTASTSTGMALPDAGPCATPDGTVLAVTELFFGDTAPDGGADKQAWKQLGFNLDGRASTPTTPGLCQPSSGGTAAVHQDGDQGIDNSFGQNVLPIILGLDKSFSGGANAGLANGATTQLLDFLGLAEGPDQAPLVTRLYGGGARTKKPVYAPTDCWPVLTTSLKVPADVRSALVVFGDGKLMGNHWESGVTELLSLEFSILGSPLILHLHSARMTADLDPTHDGALNGQLGGVLDTEEFIAQVQVVAGLAGYCPGPIVTLIETQIRQASDIGKDGTQKPGAVCDGISVGLGFTAKQVALGNPVLPPAPPANPCP